MPARVKIELENVNKVYRRQGAKELLAVDGISLSIRDGEFVALVGPSGCGKSTLLNIMAGFEHATRGVVRIDGAAAGEPSRKGILITQAGSVFPWMTVRSNLYFGGRGLPPDEREALSRHYIDLVGLAGFEEAFPHQLSGGMLQRVEVARALMAKPDVLYMDEPFGALDALTRLRMRTELLAILARDRHTCILVTHDVEEALHVADRVVVLTPRPGRLQADLEVGVPHPRALTHPRLVMLKERVLEELGLSPPDIQRDAVPVVVAPRTEDVDAGRWSLRPIAQPVRQRPRPERFDVIVIGGGPGGSTAAAALASQGLSTLVLERELFPRYHIGESLQPAAWDILDQLGLTAEMQAEGFVVKQGISIALPARQDELTLCACEYPEHFPRTYTYHVERARFDEILLHNARDHGAVVREAWTVRDVLFEEDRAVGVVAGPNGEEPNPIFAPVIVDATGQGCLLARKLGWRRFNPALNKISHYTQFVGAHRPDAGALIPPEHRVGESAFTTVESVEGGWAWYIPLRDDIVSVGVVLDPRAESGARATPSVRFASAISSSPRFEQWLADARPVMGTQTVSSMSYLNERFVGNGFLLVGDASMFVDPIFSVGVTLAMRSGIFAAEAIKDCFSNGNFSAARLASYEERLRRPLSGIFPLIHSWYATLDSRDSRSIFDRARENATVRERLLVLMCGGYDRYDWESLLAAGAAGT